MLQQVLSRFRPASARILDAGIGSKRWLGITEHLLPIAKQPIVYIERNESRAAAAARRLGDAIAIQNSPIGGLMPATAFDLLYLDLPNGEAVVNFARDVPLLRAMLAADGMMIVTLPADVDFDFDALPFTLEAELRLDHSPAPHVEFRSLVLKPGGVASPENAFPLLGAVDFLARMSRHVHFQSVDEYVANRIEGRSEVDGKPLHFIKHDIHHNLISTMTFAREEARAGIRATYFAMWGHELTAKYGHRSEYIEFLKEISSLGHDIGLHVDTFQAAQEGFEVTVGPFLDKLRAAGIAVRAGNTHGNTKLAGHPWFNGQLVFKEKLAEHPGPLDHVDDRDRLAGTLSLATLAEDMGIDCWFDSRVHYKGRPLAIDRHWIGDNYRALCLYRQAPPTAEVCKGDLWSLDSALTDHIVSVAAQGTCIYLLHPQHYR